MSALQGSFVRHNTPLRREIKDMWPQKHVKTPGKSHDGHIVAHNPNKLVGTVCVSVALWWCNDKNVVSYD